MSPSLITGTVVIALPIAFNVLFALLAKAFAYPDVLRHEPAAILERFRAGGPRLIVLWWLFLLTAVALMPAAALVAAEVPAAGGLVALGLALGITAGLVQALGLARWPFLVPVLARRHAASTTTAAERAAIEVVFEAAHRYLGVAIGEHLGYLLTGAWTIVVGLSLIISPDHPDWLGWLGAAVGAALMVGSMEFVGRDGDRGWSVAESLVPIAYIAWSGWLIVLGLVLILGIA